MSDHISQALDFEPPAEVGDKGPENESPPASGAARGELKPRFGERPLTCWLNQNEQQVDEALQSLHDLMGGKLPAFAVVGLGRCGCHVTAELAEMISSAHPSKRVDVGERPRGSWLSNMFAGHTATGVLSFEPIMVVGDIDETTFDDVRGLLANAGVAPEIAQKILRLGYTPLAQGGAGHVPPFAEFLTLALLSQPQRAAGEGPPPWLPARTYLIDGHLRESERTRLFFYIFSTGGGTGAGSAAELMRAQRFSMCISDRPEPQMYFTGVAILPESITKNRKHLINTGRTLVQYLADLNLRLERVEDYEEAPIFQSRLAVTSKSGEKRVMPWEGLALISNDVMGADHGVRVSQEEMESNANQYIAQQMFNLSAAQLPVATFEEDANLRINKRNYQAIRLDPQDLRTSLVGPYGICFSVGTAKDVLSDGDLGLDRMFVRAIGLPAFHESRIGDHIFRTIEGISIAPEEKGTYAERLNRLRQTISPSEGEGSLLTEKDFEDLASLPIFERCPRCVFVFTAPQEGEIPARVRERFSTLLSWLLPNLDQTRVAIVRGTTAHFTLSVYIETSVVLCPDVQKAIKNYLKLCWSPRRGRAQEFLERWETLITQEPPLADQAVLEWLGERENYGVNVPNFSQTTTEIETRWRQYIESNCEDAARREELQRLGLDTVAVTAQDVAAALRFLNYANSFAQPEMV